MAYVDEESIVQKVEIAKGIGAGLDEDAMEAFMNARFYSRQTAGTTGESTSNRARSFLYPCTLSMDI